MKRSGFTMIELVFVIVILGILASVAIPKLAATRDDANIAKASTEISSLISDLGSYYTAHGEFATDMATMTNVDLNYTAGADFKTDATEIFYNDKTRGVKCIKITSVDVNGTVKLEDNGQAANSLFCKGLAKAVASLIGDGQAGKVHTFGGSSIYQ